MIGDNPNSSNSTLEAVRQKLNMSMRKFADELGISHSQLSRYESGKQGFPRLGTKQLKRLNELLKEAGYTIDDLED